MRQGRAYPTQHSARVPTSLCWRHLRVVLYDVVPQLVEYHGSLAGANSPVGLWDVYKAICWTWTSCCAALLPLCAHHLEAVRAIYIYIVFTMFYLQLLQGFLAFSRFSKQTLCRVSPWRAPHAWAAGPQRLHATFDSPGGRAGEERGGAGVATVGAEHVAKGGGEIGCPYSGGGGSGWVGKSDVFPINDGEMICDIIIYIYIL